MIGIRAAAALGAALSIATVGTALVVRDDPPAAGPAAAVTVPSTPPSAAPAVPAPAPSLSVPALPPPTSAAPEPTRRADGLPVVPRPGEPVAAPDARGLAAQLRDAARAIADPATPPRTLARQSHVRQVALRALVNAPERQDPTYALLEPRLRAAVRSEVMAGAALRAMIRRPKATLPKWRIVVPAPAEELLGHYRAASREFGVPWQYLASIHLVETRMGRIRGTSSAGAQGPMQFMPATWRAYGAGGDIHSNRDSIHAAARYLRASGAPARMRKALYAYNHDDRYVDAVVRYAERMAADPRAYYGYHGWQVYYVTTAGDVWLPEGFANA
ncbi:MAG TPA: transglycosylase SLT domain-containing protein [Mycobacteriales bacterium]|nr:transglycosylase SLT domain-containing protein [Mycobacteriales bacterium]